MISTNFQTYSLDDGKVFIDIATEGYEGGLDISTWMEIRQAANDIIQRCVTQSVPKGGTIAGLGKSKLFCLLRKPRTCAFTINLLSRKTG